MKKTRQSGITLVALVVTIVVLLILAGVSISLVLGQNGLIANAKEAREKTKNATDEESQLVNGTIPDYIAEQVNGTTSGGNTPTEPETPTTGNASSITKDDYGKVVTNYKDGHTWEIFYADNTNVYLITRDNVGSQTLSTAVADGSGYNGTGDFDGSANFKTKYPAIQAGWLNKTYTPSASGTGTVNYTSRNPNMKATEYLLDSSVWNTTYKTEKADWAIGAPTLEMLAASYGKYEGTTITIADLSKSGYAQTITGGLTTSKANGLYNHGYSYWLAGPSSHGSYYIRFVRYDSERVVSSNYVDSNGVRPVVCLNSDVILTKSEDGSKFTIN